MIKKITIRILFFFSIVSLSMACIGYNANAKEIIQKEFAVNGFSALEIDGPCNVFIRQGNKESVTVRTAEENMKRMFIENQGDILVIEFDSPLRKIKQIDVFITIVKVDRMFLKGAGNIESKNLLKLDTLTIENDRAGNLNLNLSCKRLNFETSGAGNVDLNGDAMYAKIKKTGVGNLNASNFMVDCLKFNNSGVGNADIYAAKELYLKSSGVGNVSFSGNPSIREYEVSGVGNVSKR